MKLLITCFRDKTAATEQEELVEYEALVARKLSDAGAIIHISPSHTETALRWRVLCQYRGRLIRLADAGRCRNGAPPVPA